MRKFQKLLRQAQPLALTHSGGEKKNKLKKEEKKGNGMTSHLSDAEMKYRKPLHFGTYWMCIALSFSSLRQNVMISDLISKSDKPPQ